MAHAKPEPETSELAAALEPYLARYEGDPDQQFRAFAALAIDFARAHPEVDLAALQEAIRFRRA